MLGLRCRALPSSIRRLPQVRPSSSFVAAAASPSSHTTALKSPPRSLAVLPSVRALSSAFPCSRVSLFASRSSHPFSFSTFSSTSLLRFALSTPSQTQSHSQFGPTQTRSFSASASLAGRRNTYNPSRRVQKRRHGFLARLRSRSGRKILMRRRAKGKTNLSW